MCRRFFAGRVILRTRNPTGPRWDGVLPQKELQLGRMFLDVAQVVEL